jgi:hypothetical protein
MSSINSTDIDAEYPVAGQDNDSQGFRDNFTTIKNSLATAKSEITTLESTTAKLNATNDFNGNLLQEADFKATTEFVNPSSNVEASQNISFLNGHYQIIQAGADITLTLADWPASGKLGRIRLQLASDGVGSRTITWAAAAGGEFKAPAGDAGTLTLTSQTNPTIVDFWTINGGTTVFRKTGDLYQ